MVVDYADAKLIKSVADGREALENLIAKAEQLQEKNYTAESWAVLETALREAKELPEDALQAQIQAAADALQNAMAKLVKKPSGGSSSSSSSSSNGSNSMGSDGYAVAIGTDAATAPAKVVSDTTVDFSVKSGSAYCFKMTVVNGNGVMPVFTVGNGNVLKTQYVTQIGNDYYFRVWAVGTPGSSTGVYTTLPGQNAVKHCTITIA